MSQLIKEAWAEALDPGIREWFYIGYQGRPAMGEQVFNVMPSSSDSEYYHSFGAISPDAWDLFKTTGRVPSVGFDQGYKTTFTHSTFAVELPVKRELIEDAKYAQITDYATNLGDSARLKREKDMASVFNNAFSSSFLGGDGVALCSDSHPHSPNKTGSTQDNNGVLGLTAANVETVRQAMMAFTDDTGEIAGVMPDLLIVPPALENAAKIITESELKTSSADNDLNPQRGRFSYMVWPYISDGTYWFMVDRTLMKRSLVFFDRIAPDISRKNADETVMATWVARMRYSYGWRDWRWVYGNNA